MVDNIIKVFDVDFVESSTGGETFNSSIGLGTLPEAVECLVTEELNGIYELSMKYPITGIRYNLLTLRRLLAVKSNPYATHYQAFRIYDITKPLNGIVEISARHISYDLSGCPVRPFSITGTADKVISGMLTQCAAINVCPYTNNGNIKTVGVSEIGSVQIGESGTANPPPCIARCHYLAIPNGIKYPGASYIQFALEYSCWQDPRYGHLMFVPQRVVIKNDPDRSGTDSNGNPYVDISLTDEVDPSIYSFDARRYVDGNLHDDILLVEIFDKNWKLYKSYNYAHQKKVVSAEGCPFKCQVSADMTSSSTLTIKTPTSMRGALGSMDGSVLKVFGGEYEFDNRKIILHKKRGEKRNAEIRYGKNLASYKQEEDLNKFYTGIYPYWYSESNGDFFDLGDDKIVYPSSEIANDSTNIHHYLDTSVYTKILPVDFSSTFDAKPTAESLRAAAVLYILANDIGFQNTSLSVSFVDLAKTNEYNGSDSDNEILLGDSVSIVVDKYDLYALVICIKTIYNVLKDAYDGIELGDPADDLVNTLSQ